MAELKNNPYIPRAIFWWIVFVLLITMAACSASGDTYENAPVQERFESICDNGNRVYIVNSNNNIFVVADDPSC